MTCGVHGGDGLALHHFPKSHILLIHIGYSPFAYAVRYAFARISPGIAMNILVDARTEDVRQVLREGLAMLQFRGIESDGT
jgi:hypothetical protein